jgi:L-alanine-DL-glutamate epimerase-like enolase superfamily enzyme
VHPYFLEFIRPFALAYGHRAGTQLAFVKIEHENIVAFGEASLPPYLEEDFTSVKKWVEDQADQVAELLKTDPFKNSDDIPFSASDPAASAALQSAILNWRVSASGKKLIDYFIQSDARPSLTLTATKNDLPFLADKLEQAKAFTHLKLKLTGAEDDLDFVRAVRNKTDLPFCVDINQGFQDREDAIQLITALEAYSCAIVEQPLKASDHEGHAWLKQRAAIPIIADESIRQYEDLVSYHEAYSGVNVKLMKCGGLFQAQKMLQFQPAYDAKIEFIKLLGCMSESSLGVATASVLASHCHMADLDSPYLTKNDPFEGFQIRKGRIESDDRITPNDKFSI